MVKRDTLIRTVEEIIGRELIDRATAEDDMLNGVQFLGNPDVSGLAVGTSLNAEFLEKAVGRGANFCIFHHGLDTRTWKSRYPAYAQERLRLITASRMTIMGFHYALDVHPKIGNNAVIVRKLGAVLGEPLFKGWGYTGVFPKPKPVKKLLTDCSRLFRHPVYAVLAGPEMIRTIGVVSGGAKPQAEHLAEMESKGVELFITGESTESVPHKMKESGINYFVCGHYATEVFGVRELGEKLAEKFGRKLNVDFIDVPNPI
ncbi:hypothetical protein A2Z33_02640 [Candidatus Gottesmanbacteria bacterium RBG_16_52_11]|uniref:Nif3-like dinuclear metal center hexameric protein n=1 Tax=Candidatus Gottesmanbacteria bacterium RBG_16_52_11 TaxID=1798374 RepID=A0A1F5YNE1_9BACT|nr:MAG: hypothetical protein A2Z33_02640 [Candidatus Gottesmanbacteria bacterium RBG_16_52_11]